MKYLLKNANLIPMHEETILRGYDLLVEDCRIKRIGKGLSDKGINVIDCSDQYVMPGLFDMHVHINTSDMIDLFLVNGVTSIRNMWGFPIQLQWRDEINAGRKFGPRIYSTGPLYDGVAYWEGSGIIKTPEKAEESVMSDIAMGYDQIKTYPSIPREAFFKLMEVANREGMDVVGHGNEHVTTDELIELGYFCLEHTNSLPKDHKEIEALAQSGMWFCPTQIVVQTIWDYVMNEGDFSEIPFYDFVNNHDRKMWDEITVMRKNKPKDEKRRFQMSEVIERGKTFIKNSDNVLLGTDTNNPAVIAGFSIHDELKTLVDDFEMTPYQAIRTGTYHAARHLNILDDLGTLEENKYADLLILNGNPIENVENSKSIHAIIKDGVLYDRACLDRKLDEIKNMSEEDLVIVFP